MKCPYCNEQDTKVIDSRPADDNSSIRRRRQCETCGKRFTTYEKLETMPFMVIKKDRSRETYDRSKIEAGILHSCHKRPVSIQQINYVIDEIENLIFSMEEKEVETTVTRPVEQSMATLNDINEVTSVSSENISMVILEFNDEVNMDSVTVDIREKLDQITGSWSDSVGSPLIMKINPDMLPIVVASVDADDMDVKEISAYVEETVQPALEGVGGVASVSASGLLEEQVNVVIREELVDDVNEDLKDSVRDSLSEAEDALREAEDKIAEGKEELEKQTSQFQNGMVQADQALSEARMQILQGEIALDRAEEELKT